MLQLLVRELNEMENVVIFKEKEKRNQIWLTRKDDLFLEEKHHTNGCGSAIT